MKQSFDDVNVQGHAFYHYTLSDGRISDAETLLADVVAAAVAITQRVFHKIVKIWRWLSSGDEKYTNMWNWKKSCIQV